MVSVGNAYLSNCHLVEHLSAFGHNHCNCMSVQDSNTCVVNKLALFDRPYTRYSDCSMHKLQYVK